MDSQIAKMAHTMIAYSTAVKPGERVLIRASSPVAEPLVQALYQEALRAGAYAFTYIHLRDEASLALEVTYNADLLGAVNPMLELMYQTSDVIIALAADEPPARFQAIPGNYKKHLPTAVMQYGRS